MLNEKLLKIKKYILLKRKYNKALHMNLLKITKKLLNYKYKIKMLKLYLELKK